MIKRWIQRYLTTTGDVSGVWTRTSPTEFRDSVLGSFRADPDDESFYAAVVGITDVRVSVLIGADPVGTYDYARNLLVNLPQQDRWYRRFGARDMYDVHCRLGPTPTIKASELAQRLRLSWIQLWDPCNSGAIIWYHAGNLLGGSNLGVELDKRRRYVGSGFG
jgi:hypothetical protein